MLLQTINLKQEPQKINLSLINSKKSSSILSNKLEKDVSAKNKNSVNQDLLITMLTTVKIMLTAIELKTQKKSQKASY